jgi:predicted nucleic acid-binding protein
VSAFIAGGPPSRVIESSIEGRIELVLADPVLDELKRVLTLKLGFEPDRVREINALLLDIAAARIDAPTDQVEAITGDPDDDVVLACGVSANVHIVVSGDRRHMLPIREHRGIRIMSPQALLAELANEH